MTSDFENPDAWDAPSTSPPRRGTRRAYLFRNGCDSQQRTICPALCEVGEAGPITHDELIADRDRGTAAMPKIAIQDPVMRRRATVMNSLCDCLAQALPDDAAAICTAYLDDMVTGGPPLGSFGDLEADAALWADTASPRELEAYQDAILRKLGRTPQSRRARLRQMATLWNSLSDGDRAEFSRMINGRSA